MTKTMIKLDICGDCARDLEHCHGVVIRHFDGSIECVEDLDCTVVAEAHLAEVNCFEPGCCPNS